MRKAIKADKNLHTNQQNEHNPDILKLSARFVFGAGEVIFTERKRKFFFNICHCSM